MNFLITWRCEVRPDSRPGQRCHQKWSHLHWAQNDEHWDKNM